MSKEKFTPGPWSAPDKGRLRCAVVAKDGEMVCDPSGAGRHEDEAEANARLIAAAPEMYRILEQIDRGHLFGWDSPLAKRIEKALRKANGERN